MKTKKSLITLSISALTATSATTIATVAPSVRESVVSNQLSTTTSEEIVKQTESNNVITDKNDVVSNKTNNDNSITTNNSNDDVVNNKTDDKVSENVNNSISNDKNIDVNDKESVNQKDSLISLSGDKVSTKVDSNKTPNINDIPDTDVYKPLIHTNAVSVYNSSGLNYYLKVNVFSRQSNFENLQNYSSYTGFTLSYINDSANFEKATFKIRATNNETKETKDVLVSLNFYNRVSADSSAADSDSLVTTISATEGNITDDASLSKYLTKFLHLNAYREVTKISLLSNSTKYRNVNLEFDTGSASYKNKKFVLIARPSYGHTWIDGTTTKKWITVTFNYSEYKSVYLPDTWSLNEVAAQQIPFTFLDYTTPLDTQGYLDDYNFFWNLGIKDICSYYGDRPFSKFEKVSSKPNIFAGIDDGSETTVWLRVYLDPIFGEWSDGSTSEFKDVRVKAFGTAWRKIRNNRDSFFQNEWGNWTFSPAETKEEFGENALKKSDGIPRRWVSNFLTMSRLEFQGKTYNQIHDYMEKKILDDIKHFFPDWSVTIKSLVCAKASGWSHTRPPTDSTWVFDVWYESKSILAGNGLPLTYISKGYSFTLRK